MPRIRTIKPEFWIDEDLCSLSEIAHLFAAALLNHCDDEGYFNANPKLLKAAIFPLREPSRSCTVLLRDLSSIGYIECFSCSNNKMYGKVVNFAAHQTINKPKPSKIKGYSLVPYEYGTDTVAVRDEYRGERKGKERKGKELLWSSSAEIDHKEVGSNGAQEVIEYLNEKSGRSYRVTDTNLTLVLKRIESGVTVDQLKKIIDEKIEEWAGTEQEKYLRPATLFNKTKCEQYVGQLGATQSKAVVDFKPPPKLEFD